MRVPADTDAGCFSIWRRSDNHHQVCRENVGGNWQGLVGRVRPSPEPVEGIEPAAGYPTINGWATGPADVYNVIGPLLSTIRREVTYELDVALLNCG